MEELEAALVKQLQTDTAVEKLEEQRKMFMSKLEELETSLSQKHNEVRQAAASGQTQLAVFCSCLYVLSTTNVLRFVTHHCLRVSLASCFFQEDVIELQEQGSRSVIPGAYEPPHGERSLGLVYPSCIESHFKTCLIRILTCLC